MVLLCRFYTTIERAGLSILANSIGHKKQQCRKKEDIVGEMAIRHQLTGINVYQFNQRYQW